MIRNICFLTTRGDYVRHIILDYFARTFPKNVKLFLFYIKDGNKKFKNNRFKIFEVADSKFTIPFKLRKFCRKNKIDILVNMSGAVEVLSTMILSSRLLKTKVIYYENGSKDFKEIKNKLYFLTQFFTTKYLTGSYAEFEKFRRFLFLSRKKCFYVPHPINSNNYKIYNKKMMRKKLKLPLDKKIIIYVGRIEPLKGSDLLFQIVKNNPDKFFILLGDLKDENFKKEKFENTLIKKVNPRETNQYYSAADLCVFLTKRDGYSYIPRESLCSGTPAIISNLKAFGPLKTHAIIKVPLDIEVIQKEINNFFKIPITNRLKIAKQGREFVIKDSSEKVTKPILLKHFLET
jgi:glycosyltransferase involved in cell wall biosynthesis